MLELVWWHRVLRAPGSSFFMSLTFCFPWALLDGLFWTLQIKGGLHIVACGPRMDSFTDYVEYFAGVVKIRKLWGFLYWKVPFFLKNFFPSLSLETLFPSWSGGHNGLTFFLWCLIHLSWKQSQRCELRFFLWALHRDQRFTNLFMSVLYRVTTSRLPEWWQ